MPGTSVIKVNFKGGIISPGDLYNILVAAESSGLTEVRFGLRQQMLLEYTEETAGKLERELTALGITFEKDPERFPNIMSSYPAEEVFINNTWLSEGVYKDIFDAFDFMPRLKVNISDSKQSFTPLLTGNINWVASVDKPHYWHCLLRFPKTNHIIECNVLVYTNDIARFSLRIENCLLEGNTEGVTKVFEESALTRKAEMPVTMPEFNLPYYEGFNRYASGYWVGIYRRDELFPTAFLKAVCRLCLETRIGQICATPWKSIIIKSIEEKDRHLWNAVLDRYQVNVRHAANELNFQVEDNCPLGLSIKHSLVKYLNDTDMRTFGVCVGVKTRRKSEVFCSILVRRTPLFRIGRLGFFHSYDILCSEDFNPNKRTAFVFSRNNPRWLLPEQLRRALVAFYQHSRERNTKEIPVSRLASKVREAGDIWQCEECLTVYDERYGDPVSGAAAGTAFELLPDTYSCIVCGAGKEKFRKTASEPWVSEAV